MTTKLSAQEIQKTLDGFHGTDGYHRIDLSRTLVATDGVLALCEMCQCFWLFGAIASWQKKCQKDEMLRDFQVWTLKRLSFFGVDHGAVLTCWRDTDNEAFHQDIPDTDFPLDEIKLYVEIGSTAVIGGKDLWVCMLPSER